MLPEIVAPTMFDPLMADIMGGAGDIRQPPAAFRVFAVGDNETEKGTYLFDDEAARQVMAAWAERKIDLTIDYEHQSLADPPIEAPNAATRWVPEIRNGELWATDVRWTDRALGYLLAGEYRYFSPAFGFDEESRRIKYLINIALTNNPAMRGIAPLVAATRGGTPMDLEKLCKDLQAQVEALKAEISTLTTKNAELTAALSGKKKDDDEDDEEKRAKASITAALSLPASARASERANAVASVAALRTSLRALTGADSDAAALGRVHAWKEAHGTVVSLTARIAEMETAQLTGDFEAILDDASKGGKLEPAARATLKEQALKISGGRLTREGVEMARAFLSARPVQVSTTPTQPPAKAAGEMHPMQIRIAEICGRDPKDVAKRLS